MLLGYFSVPFYLGPTVRGPEKAREPFFNPFFNRRIGFQNSRVTSKGARRKSNLGSSELDAESRAADCAVGRASRRAERAEPVFGGHRRVKRSFDKCKE